MKQWLNRCHFGDVRDVLRRMIADGVKVNTIVTSPPYWGLRDYGHPGQLGLEPTIGEFIANMTEVFTLAREVLADDGTCWVNMGDSYAGSWGAQGHKDQGGMSDGSKAAMPAKAHGRASFRRDKEPQPRSDVRMPGLKPKDLIGQPWRLAFALQDGTCQCSACGLTQATSSWHIHNGHRVCVPCLIADNREAKVLPSTPGWWLRQDIIWSKPNPMPESIRDRCTKAHEYMFLLSKSERYYFDQEAIKEPVSPGTHARMAQDLASQVGSDRANGGRDRPMKAGGRGVGFGHGTDAEARGRGRVTAKPSGWAAGATGRAHDELIGRYPASQSKYGELTGQNEDGTHRTKANLNRKLADHGSGTKSNASMDAALAVMPTTRNKRSVWTVATESFKGAHFATYPRKLIEPCILAGSKPGGVVLDIFFGSGTSGQVAQELGRDWIGIEINRANEQMQHDRIGQQLGLRLEMARG